jgi:hypothetical protein
VRQAAGALVQRGYLLPDDVDRISQRASGMWDLVVARTTVHSPAASR